MQKGKNKKNFVVYSAEEFIAAITQHITKKSFQMIRYYGWYSNKSRGLRAKTEISVEKECCEQGKSIEERILDVSKYCPKNSPSLAWRECIKKIWKEDPLICPECQHEMRIISFITESVPIRKILKYLGLWGGEPDSKLLEYSRDPPISIEEIVYTPIDDGWHQEMDDLVS